MFIYYKFKYFREVYKGRSRSVIINKGTAAFVEDRNSGCWLSWCWEMLQVQAKINLFRFSARLLKVKVRYALVFSVSNSRRWCLSSKTKATYCTGRLKMCFTPAKSSSALLRGCRHPRVHNDRWQDR